jgi:hypothetical protein
MSLFSTVGPTDDVIVRRTIVRRTSTIHVLRRASIIHRPTDMTSSVGPTVDTLNARRLRLRSRQLTAVRVGASRHEMGKGIKARETMHRMGLSPLLTPIDFPDSLCLPSATSTNSDVSRIRQTQSTLAICRRSDSHLGREWQREHAFCPESLIAACARPDSIFSVEQMIIAGFASHLGISGDEANNAESWRTNPPSSSRALPPA